MLIQWIKVRLNDLKRLKQCVTCTMNPETCGCNEKDEDTNGMCQKWRKHERFCKH